MSLQGFENTFGLAGVDIQRGNILGRWRRMLAEEIFKNPDATENGRIRHHLQ